MTENSVETSGTGAVPEKKQISGNTVMISANTPLDGYKLKNFYINNAFQGFVWMIFHFSVVFFFTFQLKSIALVGIFLGIANAFAFFIDIPVGILQRYFSTKRLFIIATISQLIATAIFFSFIYNFFSVVGDISKIVVPEGFESVIAWFFGNILNWILILIASICYGLTKEINDIATYGYILSHASPSEYGKILARNNITFGIGTLSGLIVSGAILSINPTFAVLSLGVVIIALFFFTSHFFDNANETIELSDISSFTIAVSKLNKENIREYVSEKISAVDLPKVLQNTKYIFLKPREKQISSFSWSQLFIDTRNSAQIIRKIMFHVPMYMVIYWTMTLVLIFGFWDTFASTFLIDFLNNVKPGWSYILLACIAVPALALQETMVRIAEKVGIKTVAMVGLGLSGISLIVMGIIGNAGPVAVLSCAFVNSLGYACGMALGQNGFLDHYNKVYAETMGLQEIDSNASAGPMKILQNAANVIGLVFGGFILEVLGYQGFFILFGIGILAILGWSIQKKDEIDI
ncbi:MAG: hypothetical protein PHY14_05065 [Candidatus Gracilibacteria bacterium]|nr:hypothetical protein [Candidatus Gracilibacteria bacterium]